MISKVFKFLTFNLEFQKFFSINRTIFYHRRSEQFWEQNRSETKYHFFSKLNINKNCLPIIFHRFWFGKNIIFLPFIFSTLNVDKNLRWLIEDWWAFFNNFRAVRSNVSGGWGGMIAPPPLTVYWNRVLPRHFLGIKIWQWN